MFSDDKLHLAKMMIFVSDRREIIVGKEKNAGYHLFDLFQQCFHKLSFYTPTN